MKAHGVEASWVDPETMAVLDFALEEAERRRVVFGATWVFVQLLEGSTGNEIVRVARFPNIGRIKGAHRRLEFTDADSGTDPISESWRGIAGHIRQVGAQKALNAAQVAWVILDTLPLEHDLNVELFPDKADPRSVVLHRLRAGRARSVMIAPSVIAIRRSQFLGEESDAKELHLCWKGVVEEDRKPHRLRMVWFGEEHDLAGHACDAFVALRDIYLKGQDSLTSSALQRRMKLDQSVYKYIRPSGSLLEGLRPLVRYEGGRWSLIVPAEHSS